MASATSLTPAKRLFSTSLRCHYHTSGAYPYRFFRNPFGVAEDGNGEPRRLAERKLVNDRWLVTRFDMPGVNSESVKVRLNEDKNIEIDGEEPILKYGYKGRFYKLEFPGNSEIFEMEQWKAVVKHGVVWLTVPLTPFAQRGMEYYHRIHNKPFPFFECIQ